VLCPLKWHRRLVRVEVLEDRRERFPSVEVVGRVRSLSFHVDDEVGVGREERLLAVGVAAVRAVRVGVDELADRQPVRGLGRAHAVTWR